MLSLSKLSWGINPSDFHWWVKFNQLTSNFQRCEHDNRTEHQGLIANFSVLQQQDFVILTRNWYLFFRKEIARAGTSKKKSDINVTLTFNSFCRSDFLVYSAWTLTPLYFNQIVLISIFPLFFWQSFQAFKQHFLTTIGKNLSIIKLQCDGIGSCSAEPFLPRKLWTKRWWCWK